jgi:hypothetical protein
MKLKTLAAIAVSSMLAASFAYAAPATSLADNGAPQAAAMPAENVGAVPSANGNTPAVAAGTDLSANTIEQMPMMDGNSNDDISADTATGDDDY